MANQFENYSNNIFYSDHKKYYLLISFHCNNDINNNYTYSLNNDDIEYFSYSNELNSLFLKGELIYKDQLGILDKYIEKNVTYVKVTFKELIENANNSNSSKSIKINTINDLITFSHIFLIESLKINDRKDNIITYKITLVGQNWLQCIKNIHFTNYITKNNSKNKCTNIFNIIAAIFGLAGLKINKNTFNYGNSNLELNYITSRNDNVITSINHLLRKLYYYYEDDALKFIMYNELTDEYNIFNLATTVTLQGSSIIILSMHNSNIEALSQDKQNQLNSVIKYPKTFCLRDSFKKNIVQFNINTNKFSNVEFTNTNINTYKNSIYNTNQDLLKKFDDLLNEKDNYVDYGAYWNNEFNIYNSSLKSLLENSSLVINTSGNIFRKPASIVEIKLDKNINQINKNNLNEYKQLKQNYMAFNGNWFVSKVRHIIYPNSHIDGKPMYRQNLVLFRNFYYDIFKVDNTIPPTS